MIDPITIKKHASHIVMFDGASPRDTKRKVDSRGIA